MDNARLRSLQLDGRCTSGLALVAVDVVVLPKLAVVDRVLAAYSVLTLDQESLPEVVAAVHHAQLAP